MMHLNVKPSRSAAIAWFVKAIQRHEEAADEHRGLAEEAEAKAERFRERLRQLTGCDCAALQIPCEGHPNKAD